MNSGGNDFSVNNLYTNSVKAVENIIDINSGVKFNSRLSNASDSILATDYQVSYDTGSLTSTLPVVSASNVGQQFCICNTSSGNLVVSGSSSQLIYSSTGAASATTRTLATGHCQFFQAIQDGATTYGWAMI